eukprot:CAMPEP_0198287342 /NCGR_PEP_ID=MMETSP1449-20131203/6202_1 /TAXON_ID=420275 /ORGANISM="Attheya septentrionalis, Strain CCMP2084" /LENGTH=606 /DNA_ID=CAMNT_0043985289 /DNA_START=170 /DNA_END=1990 /DNA_ORIENTATION=+
MRRNICVLLALTSTTATLQSVHGFVPSAPAFGATRDLSQVTPITHLSHYDSCRRGISSLCASATATSSTVDPLLPPVPEEWRGEVLAALSSVIDPDLKRDIVTLGFVQKLTLDESSATERVVSFDVELTTPACPVKEQFATECRDLVNALDWTTGVQVTMTAQSQAAPSAGGAAEVLGLSQVGSIIAVSSCKGGVGKSTTAVQLAYTLQNMGATVGIFDADVYGPSLPTMVTPDNDVVTFVGRQIAPLQRNGVRLMSFGYVNEGAAIMRGAMVTQLLDQFLSLTNWGALDYLILDMPPGTGDIQLTLSQKMNITAAVIVTTPQELSFADVVRGIDMFDSVNVPCVAVVENMAYYESSPTKSSKNADMDWNKLEAAFVDQLKTEGIEMGKGVDQVAQDLVQVVKEQQALENKDNGDEEDPEQIRIFGPGHRSRLAEQYGIEHTFSIPLLDKIAAHGDSGTPFVLSNPDSKPAKVFHDLAACVVKEVAKAKFTNQRPQISFDEEANMLSVDDIPLGPRLLRQNCKCASCVDEMSGRQLLIFSEVPETVKPLKMEPCGNYALSIDWSDGHKSLYPYKLIKSLLLEDDDKEEDSTRMTMEDRAHEKLQAS